MIGRGWGFLLLLAIGCESNPSSSPAVKPVPGGARVPEPQNPGTNSPTEVRPLLFAEVDTEILDFRYENGETGRMLFQESFGGGNGWLDYDRDGRWDLYFVQGGDATQRHPDGQPLDRLYRRTMAGHYRDVTEGSGIHEDRYSQGVAIADYDSDGFPDIYVTNVGPNTLWRNLGDGTFQEVGQEVGVADPLWSTSAAWADLDADGDLDLYVCNYVEFNPLEPKECRNTKGELVVCSPKTFQPLPDHCYINLGDGQFTEESERRGLMGPGNRALGCIAADFNRDGWMDVYVANDATENFLFVNRGQGMFQEQAVLLGCALDRRGLPQASMGLAVNDFDGNGFLDIYSTHFFLESNTLYANLGPQGFQDATGTVGLHEPTLDRLGFGSVMADFNRDGAMDIFVTNGHIDNSGINPNQRMRDQLFTMKGKRFADVSKESGPYFSKRGIGRGVSIGDLDEDGDLDLVVSHQNSPASLLRNESIAGDHHWIGVQLVGTRSNRDGLGCQVTLLGGLQPQTQAVQGGGSYCSSQQPVVFFGVASNASDYKIRVAWLGGGTQECELSSYGGVERVVEIHSK